MSKESAGPRRTAATAGRSGPVQAGSTLHRLLEWIAQEIARSLDRRRVRDHPADERPDAAAPNTR